MGVKCSLFNFPFQGQSKMPHPYPCTAGSRARQELQAVIREASHVQEQIQHMVPGKSFYFSASKAQWGPAERCWS